MTADEEFAELSAATRKHIVTVYDLPAEMIEAWEEIDRESSEETTT